MRELLPAHRYATAVDATGPPEGTITTFAGQTSSNQQITPPPKPTKNATTGHSKMKPTKQLKKVTHQLITKDRSRKILPERRAMGQNEAPKNPDQE